MTWERRKVAILEQRAELGGSHLIGWIWEELLELEISVAIAA